MKRLTESLGAKISAMALILLLVAVLFASGAGVAVMIAENAYTDDGAALRRQLALSYLSENNETVADGYQSFSVGITYSSLYGDVSTGGVNVTSPEIQFRPQETNYRFTITDEAGTVLMENGTCDAPLYEETGAYTLSLYKNAERQTLLFRTAAERDVYLDEYLAKNRGASYAYDEVSDEQTGETARYILILTNHSRVAQTVYVHGMVAPDMAAHDALYARFFWLEKLIEARGWLVAVMAVSFVGIVLLGIFLLCAAGHKAGVEGIHLNWVDRIPFDLYAALLVLAAIVSLVIIDGMSGLLSDYMILGLATLILFCVWCALLLLALVMSFATRAKAGAWWRNTLVFRLLHGLWELWRWFVHGVRYVVSSLSLVWKTVLAVVLVGLFSFLMILPSSGQVLMWLLLMAVCVPVVLLTAIGLRRLQKGSEALADGDLDHPIDTAHLHGDLLEAAETLNRIGDGMTKAVNERMKSERMKTELITNVSHDIKTPLTSIVNYVDLLKKEQPEGERVQEYLEVLDRQSARLKKLIEDLVEASKASSGALSVHLEPCEAGILLTQVAGEYEEKAAAQQLELRVSQPEEPVMIAADGRHLSRVLENLMNNICKYSQPATRVYLSLERQGNEAVITLRNISRVPLNLSGEELTERFVRGDSSRNTEGSGLGLSIARSLTELQNGRLELTVDGDLFKVTLRFPVCSEN